MSDEQTGAVSQAVDLTALNAKQVALVQDGSRAARATGAVFIPFLDAAHAPTYVASTQYGNLQVRGSCGVTFVSPHYAITSSHCFSDANAWDPANQTFTTTTYDVSSATPYDFNFDSAMQGTFPNYTPIFGHTMPEAAGYTSTSFSCRIASRCAYPGYASNYNCDGVSASDVTMLYCSSRSAQGQWLPIANDSATTGPVTMYWFHELFMTNNDPEKIAHYTNYSSNLASNWHYLAAPTNAFLPFKSVPWSSGPRGRFGGSTTEVQTDLYGCHGTSGSGVLNGTGTALLGPVHTAGWAWGNGRLCDDPDALTPGAPNGHGLTYNSNVSVNNLVNAKYLTALQNDRTPPPYCGDGMCNGTESHTSCPSDCEVGDCTGGKVDCCGDGVCRTAIMCSKMHCL